jgi:hypothetical protein
MANGTLIALKSRLDKRRKDDNARRAAVRALQAAPRQQEEQDPDTNASQSYSIEHYGNEQTPIKTIPRQEDEATDRALSWSRNNRNIHCHHGCRNFSADSVTSYIYRVRYAS